MFTIAGGIVLGFGAIWLILVLIAHIDEIFAFVFQELPKIALVVAIIGAVVMATMTSIGWAFNRLPDMGKAIVSLGGFLLFVLGVVFCAIRDFRKWRRERRNGALY